MMIYGDDTEFKQLENQMKVCCAMTDAEKSGEKRLGRNTKKEIAEVSQL